MAVYVEQLHTDPGEEEEYARMAADELAELHEVARDAGIPAEQFSGHDGSSKTRPHYKVTTKQRDQVMGLRGRDIRGVGFVYV